MTWMRRLLLALLLGPCGSWALWTECSLDDVVDLGPSSGKFDDFFGAYVREWSGMNIDSGASLEDARFFMRWTYILTKSSEVFSEVTNNCLFGTLTILLQALPAVDYERGRQEAIRILTMARRMLAGAAASGEGFDEAKEVAEAQGWRVQELYRALRVYEVMLGEASLRPSSAGCSGPKIYIYPLPETSSEVVAAAAPGDAELTAAALLRTGAPQYLAGMTRAPLQCLFGMYGTELLFHRRFAEEAEACGTSNPAEADLFFVPSYFKCIEVLNYFDKFDPEAGSEAGEATALFEATVEHVRTTGSWFERHDGADHIFLFSWGRHPCRLPGWRAALRSAVMLQVEDRCEDLNSEGPMPSFSRWKDVIIPGHIDQWRAFELKRLNRAFEQRDVILSFHGRFKGNADSYGNVTVRSDIMKLQGLPGVSVGGFIEEYHELLGSSIFCLAPRGITPWTIHAFVAMLAGCIPVILSDDLEPPFQEIIDWPSFSIKWPMEETSQELYAYLASIPKERVREMKRQVDKHSCWFDYYSDNEECSPFVAVLRMLWLRVKQRPGYAGRFWGPGLGEWDRAPRDLRSGEGEEQEEAKAEVDVFQGTSRLSLIWRLACPQAAERQSLRAMGAELFCRSGLEFEASSSPQATLVVASEADAELLVSRANASEAGDLGWRLLVFVQRTRYLPYVRSWARSAASKLVLAVAADMEEVLGIIQQVVQEL